MLEGDTADVGKVCGEWQEIISERRIQELSVFVIDY
jgi:hypothetical protein